MVSRVSSDGRGHLGRSRCRRAGGTGRRAGEGRCRCAARRVCPLSPGRTAQRRAARCGRRVHPRGDVSDGGRAARVPGRGGGGLARGAPAGEARDAGADGAGRSRRRGRGAARQACGSRARRVRRGAEAARGRGGHAPAAALAGHARGRARAHRARLDRRGAGTPRRSPRRGRLPLRRGGGLERAAHREAGARPGAARAALARGRRGASRAALRGGRARCPRARASSAGRSGRARVLERRRRPRLLCAAAASETARRPAQVARRRHAGRAAGAFPRNRCPRSTPVASPTGARR